MKNKIGKTKLDNKTFEVQIDKEWYGRLMEKQKDHLSEKPSLKLLKDKLESLIEGSVYCPAPEIEEEIKSMVNYGKLFGKTGKIIKGNPSSCHENSCLLFLLQNQEYAEKNGFKQKKYNPFEIGEIDLYTGYALSDDGVWRQHSWCVGKEGKYKDKPIETTVKRINYFGFKLEGKGLYNLIESYFL